MCKWPRWINFILVNCSFVHASTSTWTIVDICVLPYVNDQVSQHPAIHLKTQRTKKNPQGKCVKDKKTANKVCEGQKKVQSFRKKLINQDCQQFTNVWFACLFTHWIFAVCGTVEIVALVSGFPVHMSDNHPKSDINKLHSDYRDINKGTKPYKNEHCTLCSHISLLKCFSYKMNLLYYWMIQLHLH